MSALAIEELAVHHLAEDLCADCDRGLAEFEDVRCADCADLALHAECGDCGRILRDADLGPGVCTDCLE